MQKSFLTFVAVVALSLVRIALAADDEPAKVAVPNPNEPQEAVAIDVLIPEPTTTRETVVIEPTVDSQTSRIRQELEKPSSLDFVETPLTEVIQFLEDLHKIQIEVDKKALEDAGMATDTPITRTCEGVTLRSALNLILRDLQLAYVVEDEVLVITTRDAAQDRLTVKVYPVDDLVLQADKRKSPPLTNALINVITSTVTQNSWEEAGGQGSIAPFRGSLVICQSEDVHEAVAQLLKQLRMPAVAVARDAMPVQEPPTAVAPATRPAGKSTDKPSEAPTAARSATGGMGGNGGGMF